jgi:DNA-binding response OmpR family regulator
MSRRTVISIEDSDGIRRLIRMTLEFDGFDVIEAADARSGMEQVHYRRPDLVLLDVGMPEVSGIEMCRQLRADPRLAAMPVVMLSAAGEPEAVQAGLDAGANAYLVKPFRPVELIDLVHRLIDAREAA